MSKVLTASPARIDKVTRFMRTPKGTLLILLGALAAIAAPAAGLGQVGPNLIAAMVVGALVDSALMLWVQDRWAFPSGALLTGMIVAMVLSPIEPTSVAVLTTAIAVASKYVVRTRWSHVFNPAAVGIVVAYYAFSGADSWWGSLPNLPIAAIIVLIAAGTFIADRINKVPLVLVFLGAFYGLFTIAGFFGNPSSVMEVYRTPDVNAALFFALFMLDDPPTSPVRYRDQIVFGLIAAIAGFLIYLTVGAVYYLPAGLLVANVWEARRRLAERSKPRLSSTPSRSSAAVAPREAVGSGAGR